MARLFDDGSSEYLEIDSATITAYPCTFAAWAYPDTDWVTGSILQVCDKDAIDQYFGLRSKTSDGTNFFANVRTRSAAADREALSTTSHTKNSWHHYCGVLVSSTDRRVYLDGGGKGTDANAVTPANLDRTVIGRFGDSSPDSYFSGSIADAAIWNAALSDTEVAVLAAGFSPLFVKPGNLVAYWPLIRDTDNDLVGGYDMTAVNTPSITTHPPGILYPAPPFIITAPAAAAGVTIPVLEYHYRHH